MNDAPPTALEFHSEDHSYWLAGARLPSVTQLLAPLVDYRHVAPELLEARAALGQEIHVACELLAEDDLDWNSVSSEALPYVAGYERFLAESGFVVLAKETPLHHARHRYAGRPDLYGELNGRRAVVDLKSASTLMPSVGPQTAAYAELLRANGHPADARYALRLLPDGTYRLQPYASPMDWVTFLELLTLHRLLEKYHHGHERVRGHSR